MKKGFRKKVFEILEIRSNNSVYVKIIQFFIIALIFFNVLAVIADSVDEIRKRYFSQLYAFEVFSVAVFTFEYVLRLWSCVEDSRWKHPVFGRIKYALSSMSIIDLLALFPFYFPFVFHNVDLRFLRTIRLIRVFRILKIGRYSESLRMFGRVLKAKREEIWITILMVFMLLVISSSLMYFAEHDAQPQVFSNIPQAMWWSAVTLTTVGYGDIYPVTSAGKLLASVISILGVALFALPTAVLASGFMEVLQNRKVPEFNCPHCGKTIKNKD